MLKEWPLVLFTLLGQMAVGLFLWFHIPFLARGRAPSPGWFVTWLLVLALVAVLTGLAVLASLFHLRHPFRARFVLSNLRSSWLSREILFELLFLGLVILAGWLAWLRSASPGLKAGLLATAGLAGLLFLASMTRLYMLPTLPAWRGLYTPVSFLLTSLVLGALAAELAVRGAAGPGVFDVPLVPVSLILVGLEIALTALAAPGHGVYGLRPGASLRPAERAGRSLHRLRITLLAAGLSLLGLDLASGANAIMNERGWSVPLGLGFVLIFAGEAAGRFHFYGLVARPGGRPPSAFPDARPEAERR